jgi:hypothetical protein
MDLRFIRSCTVCNGFDAGRSIKRASGGGRALEIKTFLGPVNGIEPLDECHLGHKKVTILP